MKVLTLIAALALGAFVSLPALAADEAAPQTPAPVGQKAEGGNPPLQKADANGDGKVSFEELKVVQPGVTQETFAKRDVNKDGFLTKEDRAAARAQAVESFKKADANNDGKVTFEELQAQNPKLTQERFAKRDKNKDGVLTQDDLVGAAAQGAGEALNKADANKDGKVTLDEAKAAKPDLTEARFKEMDRNGDGVLTKDDFAQAAPGEHARQADARKADGAKGQARERAADRLKEGRRRWRWQGNPRGSQEGLSENDR